METADTKPEEQKFSLLAAERFGDKFVGEPPEKEESAEVSDEINDESQAEQADESQSEEQVTDEPQDELETKDDEVPISSLNELIEHNEYDPEWVNSLKVPVKVDGKPSEATLSDLVRSYQMQEAAEKRLEDAKSKAKTIIQEAAEKSEAIQGQFAVAAKLIESAEKSLDKDVQGIDWSKLREDDPAEYSARKNDIAERRQQINQMKQEAISSYKEMTEKQQAEVQTKRQEHLESEQSALLEKLPEWRDPEKAQAEKSRLSEYLMSQGFTTQDVQGASDHRLILLARKAMLHDELKEKSDTAKKKVVKVPKVLKPGAPKSQETVNKDKLKAAYDRMKKTGSIEDAFAYQKLKTGGT